METLSKKQKIVAWAVAFIICSVVGVLGGCIALTMMNHFGFKVTLAIFSLLYVICKG